MHNLFNSFLAVNEEERFERKFRYRVGLKKKALSGVCSSGIRVLIAKPTKTDTSKKKTQSHYQSHYFRIKSAFVSRHLSCLECLSRILHFAINWLLFLLLS